MPESQACQTARDRLNREVTTLGSTHSTLTTNQGTYPFDYVSLSEYTLVATKAEYESTTHHDSATSGQTVGVNFVLTSSATSWGTASARDKDCSPATFVY